MTFLLRVDGHRWRHTVDAVLQGRDDPGTGGRVVPVAKSNGYGLGQALIARQMRHRQRPVLSVGTIYEALEEHLEWNADLLVLTPWQVGEPQALDAWRRARHRYGTMLITTIADTASLHAIAEESLAHPARPIRILVEGLTSVKRFGFPQPELQAALREPVVVEAMAAGALRFAGLALHLPIVPPQVGADRAHPPLDRRAGRPADGRGQRHRPAGRGMGALVAGRGRPLQRACQRVRRRLLLRGGRMGVAPEPRRVAPDAGGAA